MVKINEGMRSADKEGVYARQFGFLTDARRHDAGELKFLNQIFSNDFHRFNPTVVILIIHLILSCVLLKAGGFCLKDCKMKTAHPGNRVISWN